MRKIYIFAVIIGFVLTIWANQVAFNQRGYYAFGGEWLIFPLVLLATYFADDAVREAKRCFKMKRSGKFYRKNEAEVMRMLGLEPTPNSGSGWVIKEDGQSEHIICQLKSTDAQSIRIDQRDVKILEENAAVAYKVPVFAIQFLNDDSVFIMCRPEDLRAMAEYIDTGRVIEEKQSLVGIELGQDKKRRAPKKISSTQNAREQFFEEKQKQYESRK